MMQAARQNTVDLFQHLSLTTTKIMPHNWQFGTQGQGWQAKRKQTFLFHNDISNANS